MPLIPLLKLYNNSDQKIKLFLEKEDSNFESFNGIISSMSNFWCLIIPR